MPRHLFLILLAVSCLGTHLSTAHAASYTFTPLDVPGVTRTLAYGINKSGQIVGVYVDQSGTHGFLYADGIFTPVDVPNAPITEAQSINDRGQIVGYYQEQSGTHGFVATQR
jgi:probable HAF family extracellular repeat protein